MPADPERRGSGRAIAIESVLLLLSGLLVATALILATIVLVHRDRKKDLDRAAVESGAEAISEARLPMDQVLPVLQPLDLSDADRVYRFSVRGYDAFVIQWRWVIPVATEARPADVWHGYLVLGCGGPHLRVYPKAFFGEPAGCVQVVRDPAFSKRFHVQANDPEAARWYMGPALRRFLLTLPMGWSFHAEPSGVALVVGGALSKWEARSMRKVLEKLLAAAEPTRTP